MNDITLERYTRDPALRLEIQAAARRERARQMRRLFEQSTHLLLHRDHSTASAAPARKCCV